VVAGFAAAWFAGADPFDTEGWPGAFGDEGAVDLEDVGIHG
jgi:hypothetical protein